MDEGVGLVIEKEDIIRGWTIDCVNGPILSELQQAERLRTLLRLFEDCSKKTISLQATR